LDKIYTPTTLFPPSSIALIKSLRRGFIEDYTVYASRLTDAPWIFHSSCAFGILSGIIGRRAWEPMFRTAPNLWILLLGPTSIYRKSTCLRIARRLILSSHKDRLVPSDFTPQSLLAEFAKRDGKSCVFFRDEVSGFFSSIANLRFMTGMKELLINLFDGDPISRKLRSEDFTVDRPYFVWLGGAVTEKLIDAVTEADILSGLMVRFILVNPKGRGPTRPLRYEVTQADEDREILELKLKSLDKFFDTPLQSGLEGIIDPIDDPRLYFVLDGEALTAFNSYAGQLERESVKDSTKEKIHARIIPLTLKLAVILAADHSTQVKRLLNTVIVPYPILLKAIYWSEIFREHLTRTLIDVGQTPGERRYESFLEFVEKNPGSTRGTLMRRFHLKAREMDEVISTLQQRGLLEVRIKRTKTRPAETLWVSKSSET